MDMRKWIPCLCLHTLYSWFPGSAWSPQGFAKPQRITVPGLCTCPHHLSSQAGNHGSMSGPSSPEVIHQFLSSALKVLSDRVVLELFWNCHDFWCLSLRWLGVIKESQRQINTCASGASGSLHLHFSCQEQWMGTCRLSMAPLPCEMLLRACGRELYWES